ncbi:hypothetical protein BKA70DRAFT_1247376 [Coprinopsis sp. MPI-PUGE-AT-0042]|nr:hypothetical protein BKA70DRAFT_1247376 [Coprinopsis sp. MPI-PUGE-AT-0042]
MSDSDEPQEYEVDFISEARVAQKRRGPKFWEFRVRWKNFNEDDDTWEPIMSFEGSEGIIDSFWERTREKRDYRDLSQFEVKDSFVPKGPPPRKKRKYSASPEEATPSKKQANDRTSQTQESSPHLEDIAPIEIQSATSSKRRRGMVDFMKESVPTKRTKRSASAAQVQNAPSASVASSSRRQKPTPFRQPNRMPSPDLVPDSDEEVEQAMHLDPGAESSNANSKQASEEGDDDSLFNEESISGRQLRTRNSRVKVHEEPNITIPAGQISAKRRAFEQKKGGSSKTRTASSSAPPAKRSSPRRNKTTASLLTADKNGLKTIKGKRAPKEVFDVDAMDVTPPEPVPPPKPDELLTLAGLDADDAEELEDFPEDSQPEPAVDSAPQDAAADRAAKLKEARENLFPSSSGAAAGSGQEWKAPTIFGLTPVAPAKNNSNGVTSLVDATPFWLNLDSSVSISTLLAEALPAGTKLSSQIQTTFKSPPGKFYSPKASMAILDSIRSNTGYGKVVVHPEDASEEDKMHFNLFVRRLEEGELYIGTLSIQVYVLCASTNATLCQRLNIPASLQGIPGQVVISKVAIEDYRTYAEAVAEADSTIWSQYVADLA